jgi:hypothetical protein
MTGRIRKHLTYANVTASLALFLAMGGTAAASVIVHSNSEIARKTVSGHEPPPGKHANLIAGSVNAKDLSPDLTSSFQLHCPADMQQAADICFEPSARASTPFVTALQTCQSLRRRLPTVAEMAEIFDHTGAPQLSEWTDSVFIQSTAAYATVMSDEASRAIDINYAAFTTGIPFRCVVGPGND